MIFLYRLYQAQLKGKPQDRFTYAHSEREIDMFIDIYHQFALGYRSRLRKESMEKPLWFDERKSRCSEAIKTIGLSINGYGQRPMTYYLIESLTQS